MWTVGDFELHLILESSVRVDGGGAFGLVPRSLWGGLLPYDDHNLITMTQHVLYVRTPDRHIVIDTGYGDKLPDKYRRILQHTRPHGTLIGALARIGVTPEQIDLVIVTHLHNDHCGGNTTYAADGAIRPVFPHAEYVVQRREYADAMRPNERTRATYLSENFAPLVDSGQMRLLDGDTELAPGVTGCVTPGHTPGHMSVRLSSGGQHALFVCDLASFAIHFERLGWMTAYDVEPLITLETKRTWQQWALDTAALLIFPHDAQRPAGRLARTDDGKPFVVPVDSTYS